MTYKQGYQDALKAAAEVCNTTVILTQSADDVRFIKDKILALPIPDRAHDDKRCNECDLEEQLAIAQADNELLTRIAWLIGSIYVHGNFVAETANERELEKLLRLNGTFWESLAYFDAREVTVKPSRAALDALIAEAKRPLESDAQQAREIVADLMQRVVLTDDKLQAAEARIKELEKENGNG